MTTIANVKNVINTSLEDAAITFHIGIATEFVSSLLSDKGHSEDRLSSIRTYLAAHFIAIRDRLNGMAISEHISTDARVEFSQDLTQSLNATHYGQTAQLLDTSGTLVRLSEGANQGTFRSFGTRYDPRYRTSA